ncbi:MAG: hypothetical protein KJO49_00385 [Bacteroidia bacterium]|nr:hypothetical protein [Bacteroidia bacterium]NNF83468.1 hypothetical protein [Flavobacteriaceae bacterium]NNK71283.1 hypothetical protein [Flavobacteriaceae bacterium]
MSGSTSRLKPFLINLLALGGILFAAHSYLLYQFYEGDLIIPVWAIHVFNSAMVFTVYYVLLKNVQSGQKKVLYLFFALTIGKMFLALLFLSPLFFKETADLELEVMNFFVPYFLYLGFEIFSIYNFLQKI